MKGLYKKIGAVVLSGIVLVGGCMAKSSGVVSQASLNKDSIQISELDFNEQEKGLLAKFEGKKEEKELLKQMILYSYKYKYQVVDAVKSWQSFSSPYAKSISDVMLFGQFRSCEEDIKRMGQIVKMPAYKGSIMEIRFKDKDIKILLVLNQYLEFEFSKEEKALIDKFKGKEEEEILKYMIKAGYNDGYRVVEANNLGQVGKYEKLVRDGVILGYFGDYKDEIDQKAQKSSYKNSYMRVRFAKKKRPSALEFRNLELIIRWN